jgi:hypothetical protein
MEMLPPRTPGISDKQRKQEVYIYRRAIYKFAKELGLI